MYGYPRFSSGFRGFRGRPQRPMQKGGYGIAERIFAFLLFVAATVCAYFFGWNLTETEAIKGTMITVFLLATALICLVNIAEGLPIAQLIFILLGGAGFVCFMRFVELPQPPIDPLDPALFPLSTSGV